MPHFTLQVLQNGPLLTAYVGVSAARTGALTLAKRPVPKDIQIRALVDTGASCTCVDPSILQSLNLTPTGTIQVNTPSTGPTPASAYQYDVKIIIPGAAASHAPLTLPNIAVICSELLSQQNFHALIGRDILEQCILNYNGSTGSFTLAY